MRQSRVPPLLHGHPLPWPAAQLHPLRLHPQCPPPHPHASSHPASQPPTHTPQPTHLLRLPANTAWPWRPHAAPVASMYPPTSSAPRPPTPHPPALHPAHLLRLLIELHGVGVHPQSLLQGCEAAPATAQAAHDAQGFEPGGVEPGGQCQQARLVQGRLASIRASFLWAADHNLGSSACVSHQPGHTCTPCCCA